MATFRQQACCKTATDATGVVAVLLQAKPIKNQVLKYRCNNATQQTLLPKQPFRPLPSHLHPNAFSAMNYNRKNTYTAMHKSPDTPRDPDWMKYSSDYPEILSKELLYELISKRLGCSRSTVIRHYRQYFPVYSFAINTKENAYTQHGITFTEANTIIDQIIKNPKLIVTPRIQI
ncbi:MAG: hypothetical protein LAT57_00190 [Balneolales bacterium]|nr:hypothetical protein [Balneolales bacterium]